LRLCANRFVEKVQQIDWAKTKTHISDLKQEVASLSIELRASQRTADELRAELAATSAAFERKVKEIAKARSDNFAMQFKIDQQAQEIKELHKILQTEQMLSKKLLGFAKTNGGPAKQYATETCSNQFSASYFNTLPQFGAYSMPS
jgi:predicted RNase H-like nuclease (RuvC/YqgF family)